jgi:hypothetical protein
LEILESVKDFMGVFNQKTVSKLTNKGIEAALIANFADSRWHQIASRPVIWG